jgi:hypothetical protein
MPCALCPVGGAGPASFWGPSRVQDVSSADPVRPFCVCWQLRGVCEYFLRSFLPLESLDRLSGVLFVCLHVVCATGFAQLRLVRANGDR